MNTARLGLMIPSSNSTMEPEFYRVLPYEITLHTQRIWLETVEYSSWMRMNEEVQWAARYLSTADVDVQLFGCTGASFAKGLGYDQKIVARMEQAVPSVRATTTSTAIVEALQTLGLKKVAFGTPYSKQVNSIGLHFLSVHGLEVTREAGLGYTANLEIGRLDSCTAYDLAMQIDNPEAQGVFLSCTNWSTMNQIDAIEQKLSKPVVTSNQASLWSCLRRLEHSHPITGYGVLLDHYLTQEADRHNDRAEVGIPETNVQGGDAACTVGVDE